MKLIKTVIAVSCFSLFGSVYADECTTIQDGTLTDPEGDSIVVGFDDWGYNYQARSFNGKFCDAYRDASWCQDWADDNLMMKWNDAWLDNKDCDGDGKLDRHYGVVSYIGSGAWLTNHQSGKYIDENGKKQRWSYFTKIVAAPVDAWVDNGQWMMQDAQGNDVVIGTVIWSSFAVIMEVYNDTGDPTAHGILYNSPRNSGLGSLTPE